MSVLEFEEPRRANRASRPPSGRGRRGRGPLERTVLRLVALVTLAWMTRHPGWRCGLALLRREGPPNPGRRWGP